jgi:Transposase domain (DUF772)
LVKSPSQRRALFPNSRRAPLEAAMASQRIHAAPKIHRLQRDQNAQTRPDGNHRIACTTLNTVRRADSSMRPFTRIANGTYFDFDRQRLKRLSHLGDQLEAFSTAVDFEIFRADLDAALAYSDGAQGRRPPFDPVMMFKILVIQSINNLSDEGAEYLINDRLSFMRFLGLGLSDRVPDARTIWLFREKLT